MRRPLDPAPTDRPVPAGLQFLPWAPERAGDFFATHEDAWSTRPARQALSESEWVAFCSAGDDFRADLSLLAVEGDEPVGFVLCEVDRAEATGWISTIGVRPRYRGRGIASALLRETFRNFRGAGLLAAELEVGDDNPIARRVYERLGFAVVGHRIVYAQPA
jgi:ribosomal protein S18 acetylase RimI-like enzyme